MKIKDMPYFNRPREKIVLKGPGALSDVELMMVIIGSGVKQCTINMVSKKVVGFFYEKMSGEVDKRKAYTGMLKIKGIGEAGALRLIAAYEFFSRFFEKSKSSIISARDVYLLSEDLINKKKEYLISINLNGRNQVISKNVVTIGLINQSLVHPREVYYSAIKDMATSVILVHNHPSGNLEPSTDDIRATEKVLNAGKIVGIPLIDHIIVSNEGFYSFKEKGLI